MDYLLDTHILIWFLFNDERLSKEAKDIIENEKNRIYFSTINLWEIQIKKNLYPNFINKSIKDIAVDIVDNGIEPIPFFPRHVYSLDTLKIRNKNIKHKDPFDKALIAQAKENKMILLTHDSVLKYYKEDCIMIV